MDWRLSLDCLHSRDFVFYHLGHCTICLSNSKEINTIPENELSRSKLTGYYAHFLYCGRPVFSNFKVGYCKPQQAAGY